MDWTANRPSVRLFHVCGENDCLTGGPLATVFLHCVVHCVDVVCRERFKYRNQKTYNNSKKLLRLYRLKLVVYGEFHHFGYIINYRQGRPVNVKHDARCVMGKVGGRQKTNRGNFNLFL